MIQAKAYGIVRDYRHCQKETGHNGDFVLPEEVESGIQEKVFDEIALDDMTKEDGFDTLLTFLDKKLKKDDLTDCRQKNVRILKILRGIQVNLYWNIFLNFTRNTTRYLN